MNMVSQDFQRKLAKRNFFLASLQVFIGLILLGFPVLLISALLVLTVIGTPVAAVLVGLWAFCAVFSPVVAPVFVLYVRKEQKLLDK